MALDSLIGKVALLATDLPGSLDLNTFSNGMRFCATLSRNHELVLDREICLVPEQVLNEVVNLATPEPELRVKSLYDELVRLIDLELERVG